MKPLVCRHCGDPNRRVNRPRGLCWVCYYAPGVRERYGPVAGFVGSLTTKDYVGTRPMPEPTQARPQTPEKLAVLMERAERGESLWHPQDATYGDPS